MSRFVKSLLALSSYFLLGILIFHRALEIGFLGDFAGDLLVSQGNWFNFAAYQWNFYVPAMAIYYGLYKLFHLNPLPYHAFHLSLIIINAWLIYNLAEILKFKPWQCWVAGLLTLFNSVASEAYFWLSTIPKVIATGMGVIALTFLVRFRQSGNPKWGCGYLLMIIMALSMESTALILPLLGLILDLYCRNRLAASREEAPIFAGLRLHIWTFGITGIFLVFRHFLGIRPFVVNLPLLDKIRTFARTVVSTFFHGLEDHLWSLFKSVSLTSEILFVVSLNILILVFLILAWRIRQGQEKRLFLILLLLWVAACLPHTLGANFSSRYLYFPGVFASLLIVDLLGSFCRMVSPKRAYLLISLAVVGYVYSDLGAFHLSSSSYLEASQIYDAGIKTIRNNLPEITPGSRLVLIDFPDYIHSRQVGPRPYLILVYRNAIPSHLFLLSGNNKFTVTFIRLSSPSYDNPSILGSSVSPEKFAELMASPQTIAFRYLPGKPGHFIMFGETPPATIP